MNEGHNDTEGLATDPISRYTTYSRRQFLTQMAGGAITAARINQNTALPISNILHKMKPIQTALDDITLWGFATGAVKVKRSHCGTGWGIGQILLDPSWSEWLPIWTWVVVHPEGLLVVDTGEVTAIQQEGSLDSTGPTGWVTSRILCFALTPADELPAQMRATGLDPAQVRWVVLTHLHLDHMDGLQAFQHAEVIVSKTEWANPYGAVLERWPKQIQPHQIAFSNSEVPGFAGTYPLTSDNRIQLVPTPGHTFGHLSVVLQSDTFRILLAGDVAFNQAQLLAGVIPGITADAKLLRTTQGQIKQLAADQPLLFLPSHDPANGNRVATREWLVRPTGR